MLKASIIGHLGRDPELRYLPSGQACCDFSIASTTKGKKDESGQSQDETTWVKVTFWGKQAEVASQYLKKGTQVYCDGTLKTREWTDKDGRVKTSLEMNGTSFQMLGSKGEANDPATNAPRTQSAGAATSNRGNAKPVIDNSNPFDGTNDPF